MGKVNLKELTLEQLKSKEKSKKTLIIVLIPLIIGLLYFSFVGYFNGKEINFAILTIAICTLGALASVYPEFKEVKKELKNRDSSQNS